MSRRNKSAVIGMRNSPLHDFFRVFELRLKVVVRLSINNARDEPDVMN